MFPLDLLPKTDVTTLLLLVPSLVILVHVTLYVLDSHGIRRFPGPFWAKFTDVWLGRVAALGHRSEVVHDLHMRYGEQLFLRRMHRIPWCPARVKRSATHHMNFVFIMLGSLLLGGAPHALCPFW